MKKMLLILLVSIIACNTKTKAPQSFAEKIKKYYLTELPDIEKTDTIFLRAMPLTEKYVCELQAAQFRGQGILDQKQSGEAYNRDWFRWADSCSTLAKAKDSTNTIYYEVESFIIYTKKNQEQAMASHTLYFNPSGAIIPKSSIFRFLINPSNNISLLESEENANLFRQWPGIEKYY